MHVNDQKNAVILETKRFNESKSDVSKAIPESMLIRLQKPQ